MSDHFRFQKMWREVRELWVDWDPLRVADQSRCPADAYEDFIGPSLHLVERDAPVEELAAYLSQVLTERLALDRDAIQDRNPWAFAYRLLLWFKVRERRKAV